MKKEKKYELFSKMNKQRKEFFLYEFSHNTLALQIIIFFLISIGCSIIDTGLGTVITLISLLGMIILIIAFLLERNKFLRGE